MVSNAKTAILLHLYYQDLWVEFKQYIQPILSNDVDLYVTVNENNEYTEDIKLYAKEVLLVANKGMDFGPFILMYDKVKDLNYDFVIKLHGKKSLHTPGFGEYWRKNLINSMLQTTEKFNRIVEFMTLDRDILMASSAEFYHDTVREAYNHPNRLAALPYINKVREYLKVADHGCFFAGSMFIVSTKYLKQLFNNVDLNVLYNQFEDGYLMDSFAHGMERVIGYGVMTYNGKYLTL